MDQAKGWLRCPSALLLLAHAALSQARNEAAWSVGRCWGQVPEKPKTGHLILNNETTTVLWWVWGVSPSMEVSVAVSIAFMGQQRRRTGGLSMGAGR